MSAELMSRERRLRLGLGLVGAAMVILCGVVQWSSGADFAAAATTADGVVLSVERYAISAGYPESGRYHPRIRFVTADGSAVTFEDTVGVEDGSQYREGDEVTVHYDPTRPEGATLRPAGQRSDGVVLTVLGVLIFVAIPFGVLLRQRADRRPGHGRRGPATIA